MLNFSSNWTSHYQTIPKPEIDIITIPDFKRLRYKMADKPFYYCDPKFGPEIE
jgi:hypothetical protein